MIGAIGDVVRGAWKGAAKALATRAAKYAGIPLRDPALVAMLGTGPVSAGVDVDNHTALSLSAVWQAVTLISSNVAAMPLVIERVDGNGVEAVPHPLTGLLDVAPNDEMTPFTFFETLQAHALTWGNGYAEIEREGAGGPPVALVPLLPNQVTPKRDDTGYVYYDYAGHDVGQESRRIAPEDMLHVPGLGYDGLRGYDVVGMAREAIGLGIAAEKFGAAFYGRGSVPGGLLEVPDELEMTDRARRNLRESFELLHRGPDNAHRVAILEHGITYKPLGLPPDAAQFLQTRAFQVVEIARWFNVPPHLLRDLSNATFSNIEHQGLDFLIYTLRPWLIRWQQEIRRKLFSVKDRLKYRVSHDPHNLLLTDVNARYMAYGMGRNGGWLTLNDIMRKERRPLLPPEIGDTRLAPSTMRVLGQADPSQPIDVAVLQAATDYLKSLKPVGARFAEQLLRAALPQATDSLVTNTVTQLIKDHIVEGP